jgi:rhamnosyltransferase
MRALLPTATEGTIPDVWAVVVLFQPDGESVMRQFAAVRPQVSGILYYDNGGGREVLAGLGLLQQPGVHCLGDGTNRGIAEALNGGLERVRAFGSAFALLLDQDSLPSDDGMVARLAASHLRASARGEPVAAVGPAIFDALRGKLEGFGQAVASANRRLCTRTTPAEEPFEVHYLITSGTLVAMPALSQTGLMEASLFIDSVDFEWCFRARARGYRLLGTYATALHHHRGERLHSPLPGVRIRLHSARRLFYIYRNHFHLCFRSYMPPVWKVRGLWYLLLRTLSFALFVPGRATNLGAMARGVLAGLRRGLAELAGETTPPRLGQPPPERALPSARDAA